jgi:hypothetical protein
MMSKEEISRDPTKDLLKGLSQLHNPGFVRVLESLGNWSKCFSRTLKALENQVL